MAAARKGQHSLTPSHGFCSLELRGFQSLGFTMLMGYILLWQFGRCNVATRGEHLFRPNSSVNTTTYRSQCGKEALGARCTGVAHPWGPNEPLKIGSYTLYYYGSY